MRPQPVILLTLPISLCNLCLGGFNHYRDTENTEVAQRRNSVHVRRRGRSERAPSLPTPYPRRRTRGVTSARIAPQIS